MTARQSIPARVRYTGDIEGAGNVALCSCGAILTVDTRNGSAIESCGTCGYSAPIRRVRMEVGV